MGLLFQIISVILIIGAVILFRKKSSQNTMITNAQRALATFQIVLCGAFFALCLYDVLDIKENFSVHSLIINQYIF